MSALWARGVAAPGRLAPADLAIEAGSLTLLVGPNGAGKTSLLRGLAGIGGIAGEIRLGDMPLASLTPAARIGRFAFMPATRELRWPLAARDVVALGLGTKGDPDARAGAIDAVLARLEATDLAPRRADLLSTGERARILIARALVARPSVLLLDEPIANLDPAWQLRIMRLLREEAARGAAVLASIHDLSMARNDADRVLVIDRGAIVADGSPAEALSADRIATVFKVRWSARGWEAA